MHRWLSLVFILLATQAPATAASGPKRVVIDKRQQVLRAYEGRRLVFESHVSTGKWDRSTPTGQFQAGSKERLHFSRLFHNAPMPYSVFVTGNVFIHGFGSVPQQPASHGCIRMPLGGGNPAKRFYDWVEIGTPIEIRGR